MKKILKMPLTFSRKATIALCFSFLCFLLSGCKEGIHTTKQAVHSNISIVQKDLFVGMSQAQMATVLGSPNHVSQDRAGNESWVYDRIASQIHASNENKTLIVILSSFRQEVKAKPKEAGDVYTIIVRFDQNKSADKLSYHKASF